MVGKFIIVVVVVVKDFNSIGGYRVNININPATDD